MKRRSNPRRRNLPSLEALHKRHYGLTPAVCQNYAEAARVCLARHHKSPTDIVVEREDKDHSRRLIWRAVREREVKAWANADDATRDGAYSVAISVVESELQCFAMARAETRTGADYYVSPDPQATDLEDALRLEVSGTDTGDDSTIAARLRQKVQQTKGGNSDLPALACVVGFLARKVGIAEVEQSHVK